MQKIQNLLLKAKNFDYKSWVLGLKKHINKRNMYVGAGILVLAFIFWPNSQTPVIETVTAKVQDLRDEVSVTGTVKPRSAADLAFEVSGKVNFVASVENEPVLKGQTLFTLDTAELKAQSASAYAQVQIEQARVTQYENLLTAEEARLADLQAGAKPEEITVKETLVATARRKLQDAEADYQNTLEIAELDLAAVYETLRSGLKDSLNTGLDSLYTLADIQLTSFNESNKDTVMLELHKGKAAELLLGAKNAKKWNSKFLSTATGGLKESIGKLSLESEQSLHDELSNDLSRALEDLSNAYNAIRLDSTVIDNHGSVISAEKAAISAEISAISSLKKTINSQKTLSSSNLLIKQIALNNANSTLTEAESNLNLSKSSASVKSIEVQKAKVAEAQASLAGQMASVRSAYARVAEIKALIDKKVIKAPYNGLVTNIDIDLGEIAYANTTVAKIIAGDFYEIQADIPETDIAQIKTGNKAELTLDAYPEDILEAEVSSINEAAETVDGVPVYRIKLRFLEKYKIVKSGMTANLDILVDASDQVISVPIRAVDDGKIKILLSNGIVELRPVETGLKSSDGLIEILNGVRPGEQVVIYMEDVQE
ncbi:efflux RND transporter periplasmic adaptor subunit [bacterium]|jgi:RND family efflux transporter MFP subunit|nr:efflux RND transporter periplasmic adaptor subunit [bacterium]